MIMPITPSLIHLIPLVLCCCFLGVIGRGFKFGFWGNFIISLVFTPIIGVIVLLAQDPRPASRRK